MERCVCAIAGVNQVVHILTPYEERGRVALLHITWSWTSVTAGV